MTRTINLTKGKAALVDDDDFERLLKLKWRAKKDWNTYYAYRSHRKTFSMHSFILGTSKGFEVDHINGNGLDNRRSNLRIVTHSQNMANRRPQRNGTSCYKGVSWNKQWQRWVSKIYPNGKNIFLGYYASEIEAAKIYDVAAIKFFGEYAFLNFKEESCQDIKK